MFEPWIGFCRQGSWNFGSIVENHFLSEHRSASTFVRLNCVRPMLYGFHYELACRWSLDLFERLPSSGATMATVFCLASEWLTNVFLVLQPLRTLEIRPVNQVHLWCFLILQLRNDSKQHIRADLFFGTWVEEACIIVCFLNYSTIWHEGLVTTDTISIYIICA